jgi:hypothetical protein
MSIVWEFDCQIIVDLYQDCLSLLFIFVYIFFWITLHTIKSHVGFDCLMFHIMISLSFFHCDESFFLFRTTFSFVSSKTLVVGILLFNTIVNVKILCFVNIFCEIFRICFLGHGIFNVS